MSFLAGKNVIGPNRNEKGSVFFLSLFRYEDKFEESITLHQIVKCPQVRSELGSLFARGLTKISGVFFFPDLSDHPDVQCRHLAPPEGRPGLKQSRRRPCQQDSVLLREFLLHPSGEDEQQQRDRSRQERAEQHRRPSGDCPQTEEDSPAGAERQGALSGA